jgi:pentatricopeptide repeat protein
MWQARLTIEPMSACYLRPGGDMAATPLRALSFTRTQRHHILSHAIQEPLPANPAGAGRHHALLPSASVMPPLAASTSSLPTTPPWSTDTSAATARSSSAPWPAPALSAASFLAALLEGRQLHALAAKAGLAPAHTVVANSLVHLYASCGLPGDALAIFRRVPDKSLVSWNAAVDALAGNGNHLGALDLFREMQRATALSPDAYTVQSVRGRRRKR